VPAGIGIAKVSEGDYKELLYDRAALYRHEEYLIILLLDKHQTLIVVDIDKNKIGCWECEYCNVEHAINYIPYYSKKQDKLILLSRETPVMIIIDIGKINLIFKSNKHSDCIGNFGEGDDSKGESSEVRCCINIVQLVAEAIARTRGYDIEIGEFKLISHYFDAGSGTLYVLATYVVYTTRYIGAFSFRGSCDNFSFKVLCHQVLYDTQMDYSEISVLSKVLERTNRHLLSISKVLLHRLITGKLGDLDMAYNLNNQRLVSIGHNRNSISLTDRRHKVSTLNIHSFEDVIVARHFIEARSYIGRIDFVIH
jgi:hypothetical protein